MEPERPSSGRYRERDLLRDYGRDPGREPSRQRSRGDYMPRARCACSCPLCRGQQLAPQGDAQTARTSVIEHSSAALSAELLVPWRCAQHWQCAGWTTTLTGIRASGSQTQSSQGQMAMPPRQSQRRAPRQSWRLLHSPPPSAPAAC